MFLLTMLVLPSLSTGFHSRLAHQVDMSRIISSGTVPLVLSFVHQFRYTMSPSASLVPFPFGFLFNTNIPDSTLGYSSHPINSPTPPPPTLQPPLPQDHKATLTKTESCCYWIANAVATAIVIYAATAVATALVTAFATAVTIPIANAVATTSIATSISTTIDNDIALDAETDMATDNVPVLLHLTLLVPLLLTLLLTMLLLPSLSPRFNSQGAPSGCLTHCPHPVNYLLPYSLHQSM